MENFRKGSVTEMSITDAAKQYHERMFPGYESDFLRTDPEFIERFDNFAFDEVVNSDDLDDRTRMMAILATLLGCQGIDEFRAMVPAALNFGVTPVEVKEIVYQAVAYLGIGRVFPFLKAVNEILTDRGVSLPLPPQAQTTMETRLAAGEQAMVDIVGESMRGFAQSGPEESRHINKWLADNCFGDYYTRSGLDYGMREMITFCFLAAQGGCEPQLTSHAKNNMNVGNDKEFLIKIISQCLPFIGYPRSLNALRCVNTAAESMEANKKETEKQPENPGVFPVGEKLPEESAKNFIGQAYIKPLTDKGGPIANVTFEPGCRNNWHIHHVGGQILLVTGGKGWYQEWGKPAQKLSAGDVVNIAPGVKHWHGAAADSWFSHLAVSIPGEGAYAQWLEPVSDEEYKKL